MYVYIYILVGAGNIEDQILLTDHLRKRHIHFRITYGNACQNSWRQRSAYGQTYGWLTDTYGTAARGQFPKVVLLGAYGGTYGELTDTSGSAAPAARWRLTQFWALTDHLRTLTFQLAKRMRKLTCVWVHLRTALTATYGTAIWISLVVVFLFFLYKRSWNFVFLQESASVRQDPTDIIRTRPTSITCRSARNSEANHTSAQAAEGLPCTAQRVKIWVWSKNSHQIEV